MKITVNLFLLLEFLVGRVCSPLMEVSKLTRLKVKKVKKVLKMEPHSAEIRQSSRHQTSDSRCSLWLSRSTDGCTIFISQFRSTKKKKKLLNCQPRITRLTLNFTFLVLELKAYKFSLLSLFYERRQLQVVSTRSPNNNVFSNNLNYA